MNELKLKGTITQVMEIKTGTSKAGNEWQKMGFVLDTKEQFNNIIAFELFGAEKIENFNKYNKVGKEVEVSFNVSCNEWEGKFFTTLNAWKIFGVKTEKDLPY